MLLVIKELRDEVYKQYVTIVFAEVFVCPVTLVKLRHVDVLYVREKSCVEEIDRN